MPLMMLPGVAQVYLAAPRMLLPVMPHLLAELGAADEQRRLGALELAGRLAREQPRLEEHFPEVLQEFVRRSRDQQVTACMMPQSCRVFRTSAMHFGVPVQQHASPPSCRGFKDLCNAPCSTHASPRLTGEATAVCCTSLCRC